MGYRFGPCLTFLNKLVCPKYGVLQREIHSIEGLIVFSDVKGIRKFEQTYLYILVFWSMQRLFVNKG